MYVLFWVFLLWWFKGTWRTIINVWQRYFSSFSVFHKWNTELSRLLILFICPGSTCDPAWFLTKEVAQRTWRIKYHVQNTREWISCRGGPTTVTQQLTAFTDRIYLHLWKYRAYWNNLRDRYTSLWPMKRHRGTKVIQFSVYCQTSIINLN